MAPQKPGPRNGFTPPFATGDEPGSSSHHSSSNPVMPPRTEATIAKVTKPYLEVGLICADRDAGTLSCHFLNDELRVQEGVQERSIDQFLAEGWFMAAPGRSL